LRSKEIVDVTLDTVAQDETSSTNLHALELSTHYKFVRRGTPESEHDRRPLNRK
jgi:hypothetical protein